MATYSFLDTFLAIAGPGGAFQIGGPGAGNSEEGFTVEPAGEKNTMTPGAGGGVMHSLHAEKTGKMTVRMLKTAPVNHLLSALYAFQTSSSANHGQNILTWRDAARGDLGTGQQTAFKKRPAVSYAKEGGIIEWEFDIGILDELLGSGSPSL